MSIYNGTLGRPVQGISSQPQQERLVGQCEDSVNFRPDLVEGLISRPGTKIKDKLNITIPADSKKYDYERDENEGYFIVIESDGTVSAFSDEGVECNVTTAAAAKTYLATGGNAKENLSVNTIADFTFIANKAVTVAESSTTTPANDEVAIVYVQFMDYQQTQKIFIKHPAAGSYTEVASYTSPDGSATAHLEQVQTDYVANELYTDLEASIGSGGTNDYTITLEGNCIFIERDDGGVFAIKTEDDAGQDNLIAIKDRIQDTSKLSPKAPDNFIVLVDPPGSNTKGNARYWLKAVNTNGEVSWRESVAPNIPIGFDLTTMPVQMVRTGIIAGIPQFSVTLGDWEERDIGDEDSNPMPSFVGGAINNIGIFQGRLAITSGENFVGSRTNRFFRFFRDSAQVSLDTDPIDIYADSDQVNVLESMIQFDGDIVLFSRNNQFTIIGDKVANPSNTNIRPTTSFKCNLDTPPVVSGENIFFAYNYGNYLGIREYFTDSLTDTKRAQPITEHISILMEGNPINMKSSTNINCLVVQSDADETTLYTYDWIWVGAEKLQSAWSRFQFNGDEIKHFYFRKDLLYLVISRSDGTYLECIEMGNRQYEGIPYYVCADRLKEVTFTWNAVDELWETSDFLTTENVDDMIAVAIFDNGQAGIGFSLGRDGSNLYASEYIASEVLGTFNAYVGVLYNQEYIPTNPVPKDSNGQSMDMEKLIITRYIINYISAGNVTIEITDSFGNTRTFTKARRKVGFPNNLVGYSPLTPGDFSLGVGKRSNQFKFKIISRDYRPLKIREIEFQSEMTIKGRRLRL